MYQLTPSEGGVCENLPYVKIHVRFLKIQIRLLKTSQLAKSELLIFSELGEILIFVNYQKKYFFLIVSD